ncbi:pre-rRNA-processing protein TSR2 homolog [Scleropages formosus]|uniref:Pre-rRNA-processing protein TSR2 homolog n=1 Tax=Scleropages formosus TaxID=113540 RepID=A0A8C9QVJ8_SCLFO|nr:pre-rRNA-processing protein TSR2 homolog [Scleropages formosus]
MEAPLSSARELFAESVRAVLETWPVLQIAVDNGFGGFYSQQKADWLVDAVQQFFQENADLQQYEVEDFLAEVMNNEFDTVVDDGSLPQVASRMCHLFQQCEQGRLSEVRSHISRLEEEKKNAGRAKATQAKSTADKEEESEGEEPEAEPMECEEAIPGRSSSTLPQEQDPALPSSPDTEDGWTVVRRKK